MAARLIRRSDLMVSRHTTVSGLHGSLRATLNWSYELLARTSSDFRPPGAVSRRWTLEAAEAVCAEPQALEYLTQLQERFLVRAEEERPRCGLPFWSLCGSMRWNTCRI